MAKSINAKLRTQALLAFVGAVGFTGIANADENPSGPYVGAAYGQFTAKLDDLDQLGDVIGSIDSDADAWKAFFGWRFNPYISVELDYVDLGSPRADFNASGQVGDYTVEMSGAAAYVIGTLPLGIFELSGKVGYYFHDLTIDVDWSNAGSGNGNVLDTDNNGEALVYGVGAGVTLIDHINAKVEYELLDVDELDDAYILWLTAAWRF